MTETRHQKKARTVQQNKSLWGIIYDDMEKGFIQKPNTMILFIQDMLKSGLFSKDLIHQLVKIGMLGGRSTTELSTTEFNELVDRIQAKMATDYDIQVRSPNEIPITAYEVN